MSETITRARLGALALLTAGAVLAGAAVAPAAADTPRLSTPYPDVAVEAGDRVALDLHVLAEPPAPVTLRIADAPEGWDASLRGGGFLVGAVYALPEDSPAVELEVNVPIDAAAGDYTIRVESAGPGGTDALDISLRLAEALPGETRLSAEFPSLREAADETFSFDVVLDNTHPQERTYALAAAGPRGWQVRVRPSGEDTASTVTLDPGEAVDLTVDAVPPPGVTAGTYPIAVRATGGSDVAVLELEAEITGTYDLTFEAADQRLSFDVNPGRERALDFLVRNDGSAPLEDVTLRARAPSGWETSFDPEEIGAIEPGESAQVRLSVTPADDAIVGDYRITVTASAPEAADELELRASVETSRAWGAVGVGLILAALGALGWVFRAFGRR